MSITTTLKEFEEEFPTHEIEDEDKNYSMVIVADPDKLKLFLNSSLDKVFQAVESVVGSEDEEPILTLNKKGKRYKNGYNLIIEGRNQERNRIRQELNK